MTAAALGVAAVVLALLYGRARVAPSSAAIEFTLAPPDNWHYSGGQDQNVPDFAIAPDGRHLALVAAARDVSMLWVRPTTGLAWGQLAGTEGARSPFWSPDSQSVAFFANGRLKVVHLAGGQPVELCEVAVNNAASGTWGRDGDIVFGANDALRKVRSRGGQPMPATTLQNGESAHLWPAFLPDGRSFLYLAQRPGVSELRVGSLTSAETVSLGPFESGAVYAGGHLLFIRGGALMAQPFDPAAYRLTGDATRLADRTAVVPPFQRGLFAASMGVLAHSELGRSPVQLTWFDRDGNPLGAAGEPGFYVNLDLDATDQRLAVSRLTEQQEGSNIDIWIIDFARDGASWRLTTHPAMDWDPAWSPDGREIAFHSNRDGGIYSLFRRSASGGGVDELLHRPARGLYAPDWSPDGRFLIYDENGGDTRNDLWILPLFGDRKLKPWVFLRERFAERNGAFSPDGRWIAYQSDESGRFEVYVRRFPAQGGSHLISRDGGRAPRWRDNGRELFFLAPDGTMMAAAIDPSNDSQAGVPRPLFKTSLLGIANNKPYVVTRDGQRFLVPVAVNPPGAAPLTIVLNWPAKLRGQ